MACLSVTAHGATFTSVPVDQSSALITVEGELEWGDEKKLAEAALGRPHAMVLLRSDGGSLLAGTEIGRAIRAKGFSTLVPPNVRCASACALAWLGGRARLMSVTARIGFQQSAKDRYGPGGTGGPGNALLDPYLNHLGLPASAVTFITAASGGAMDWLTIAELNQRGVEVRSFETPAPEVGAAIVKAPAPLPPQPVPAPPQSEDPSRTDWSSSGRWIMIFSRPTLPEAIAIAAEYKPRLIDIFVFRFQNGWYGVVLGPHSPEDVSAKRAELVATGAIPSDSFVVRGDKLLELAWGGAPKKTSLPLPPPPTNAAAERAAAFALSFWSSWSSDNDAAIAFLERAYSPEVVYFGNPVPKSKVLEEKQRFAARWPQRAYRPRLDSMTRSCDVTVVECTISGIVDWTATDPVRRARSTGSAQFELKVSMSGRPALLAESSTVLTRERTKLGD